MYFLFNVCLNCGEYRVDKYIEVKAGSSYALCPVCGYGHPFLRMPLFVVTGASGSGKTACVHALSSQTRDFVVMETDILWDERYNTPDSNFREYREMWLRIAKNITQCGKPVILCGTAMPEQIEPCLERRYFSDVFYLALVCSDDALIARLKNRPSWRASGDHEFINSMLRYNQWLKEHGPVNDPIIYTLDTTEQSPPESAVGIHEWAAGLAGASLAYWHTGL